MPLTIISEKMLITGWFTTTLMQLKQEKYYNPVATIYSNTRESQRKSIFKLWFLEFLNQNVEQQGSQILGPTPDVQNKNC